MRKPEFLNMKRVLILVCLLAMAMGASAQTQPISAKLADTAQSLELGRVDEAKEQRIRRPVQPEGNDIMNRVADDFLGHL